jgi:hypothetical protein
MSGRKQRNFDKKNDSPILFYLLLALVILSLILNVTLLVMFQNIETGKDGIDGKNGIDGIDGIDGTLPDNIVLQSLKVMDSFETYGTVDLYAAEESDSRRLLSSKPNLSSKDNLSRKDHCSTCENKFTDSNTCLSRCNSHIKLEKNGFNEIFHVCCQ